MAGITLRRGLAALVLGVALAVGAGLITGAEHASAQVIPNKTCTGSGPGGVAEPGDTLICVVSAAGAMVTGDSLTVEPTAPTGAAIPVTGCSGASGGTAPATYTTAAAYAAGACTYTLTLTGTLPTVGNNVIGSELLHIPSSVAAGTSVTQEAKQCGPAVPVLGVLCSPFLPMGTSGAGSCVGGTALPIIGGCTPALPLPTPTPTASSSSGGGTTPSDNGTQSAGGVQAAAATKSTPFTSGPEHPLPVAATLVAVGGGLLVVLGGVVPVLLRRRRGR